MASINKIILPNGNEYNIQVQSENITGIIPYSNGGTGADSLEQAKVNLGIVDIEVINADSIDYILSQ